MAVTDYYFDFAAGDDTTGDGSSGTPWKTIQKGLTSGAAGADGTRFYCENGTDTYTVSLTVTITISQSQPLWIIGQNYTGRTFPIVHETGGFTLWPSIGYVHWQNMEIKQTSSNRLWYTMNGTCWNCKLTNTGSPGDYAVQGGVYMFCEIDFTGATNGMAAPFNGVRQVQYCLITGRVKDTSLGFFDCSVPVTITHNIIKWTGANAGVVCDLSIGESVVGNNTIIATGTPTGKVFLLTADERPISISNNIVVDWDGVGAVVFDGGSFAGFQTGGNYLYNYTSDKTGQVGDWNETDDEASGVDDPIARDGSLTWANRLVYAAPQDVGNVLASTFQGQYKGAVAPSGPLIIQTRRNTLIGR